MDPNYTFTQQEIDEGKTMAGIAYIGLIGLLVAYLADKENRFVLYHCQQSIVNCILSFTIIGIPIATIFTIIGAIYGFSGKVEPLPLIGQLGFKFNLLKPDQPADPQA